MELAPFFVIFALFSPLWWFLILISSGLIVWSLEEENGLWATVVLVVSVLLMTFFGTMPEWSWFVEPHETLLGSYNGWTLLLAAVVSYFLIGAVWGCGFKWYFYCVERREKYDNYKVNFLRARGITDTQTIPSNLKKEWANSLIQKPEFHYKHGYESHLEVEPKYWNHKARVMRWMTYWPWSMFWSLLDDVVRNIFRHLQRLFNGVMDKISKFVFRGVADDFDDTSLD